MKKKTYSIDQLATETVRKAQSEAATLQSDLKKLRTSLRNMDRLPQTPKIKAKRTRTKKLTSTANVFGIDLDSLGLLGMESLLGDVDLLSVGQQASRNLTRMLLGQRIR